MKAKRKNSTAKAHAFMSGFASVFNFSFTITPPTPQKIAFPSLPDNDTENLRNDWRKVGESLRDAATAVMK